MKRAYFLCLDKNKKIYELEKNDLGTVFEFCSQQIRDNFLIQAHMQDVPKFKFDL